MRISLGTTLALFTAVILASCETEVTPSPAPPSAAPQAVQPTRVPWEAAIGELDIGQPNYHCSAVLVAPNKIVTASHCLTVAAQNARPLIFSPGHGDGLALPTSSGIALKWGAQVNSGSIANADVPVDWAVVEISPPVSAVQPLPVASLSLDDMLARVAAGARVIAAGYGASNSLIERGTCHLYSEQELGLYPDDSWLQLDCLIQDGDSGGAIVLLDGGRPWLIGIIAGRGRNPKAVGKSMGLAVNSRNFAPYVAIPVSILEGRSPRSAIQVSALPLD